MSKYEIIIYWSEDDDAFVAEVPELPGCMADGATYKEALANVEVIISRRDLPEGSLPGTFGQEWIDTARELGRPIPEPKGRLLYA